MAYEVPFEFAHGTNPTAANFNTYKNALDAIYARTGGVKRVSLVLLNRDNFDFTAADDCGFTFCHRRRYLWYKSTGQITSLTDDTLSTTLSHKDDTNHDTFDLDSVSWLAYGDYYRVQGVTWCIEMDYTAA